MIYDFLAFRDVAIKQIPTIPMTVAIPVVLSPKILPCHIKKAPVKATKIPNIFCFMLIMFLLTNYLDPYSILPKNHPKK